jgi:hypothetical protein
LRFGYAYGFNNFSGVALKISDVVILLRQCYFHGIKLWACPSPALGGNIKI